MTPAGRPPVLVDGLPARKRSPAKRGYTSISLSVDLREKLGKYGAAHGCDSYPAVVVHLLDAVESPPVVAPEPVARAPIPWNEIESALIDQFGFARRNEVSEAIRTVKAALE